MHNLALITWIDQNAWFDVVPVKGFTLREWSQTRSQGEDLKGLRNPSTPIDFQIFLGTLERILTSGMRLAIFKRDPLGKSPQIGMVHPDAQAEDLVCFVQGCSISVF